MIKNIHLFKVCPHLSINLFEHFSPPKNSNPTDNTSQQNNFLNNKKYCRSFVTIEWR